MFRMIQRKSIFFLGVFILLLSSSFLGLPSSWKTVLLFLSGLTLIFLSVKLTLSKKLPNGLPKKEKVTPVFVENSPIYPTSKAVANSSQENSAEAVKQTENTNRAEIK